MRRYGFLTALVYDVGSGERIVYRAGRLAAVRGLQLRKGDVVLVLGCGTGLDLPPIAAAVGERGTIVAVDDSAVMLRRSAARGRTSTGRRRPGWPTIRLVQADLTRTTRLLPPGVPPVDAVLAVNTLSLIPDRRTAWRNGLAAAAPGARVAVADIARPTRPLTALWARWISFVGLGDLEAHPWTALEEGAEEVESNSFHAGHVQVRSGRLPRG